MRYFAHIHADFLMTQNNLQKAWQAYLKTEELVILENEEELERFKARLKEKMHQLNQEFSRCKPLVWSCFDGERRVLVLGVNGISTMAIWQEREAQNA